MFVYTFSRVLGRLSGRKLLSNELVTIQKLCLYQKLRYSIYFLLPSRLLIKKSNRFHTYHPVCWKRRFPSYIDFSSIILKYCTICLFLVSTVQPRTSFSDPRLSPEEWTRNPQAQLWNHQLSAWPSQSSQRCWPQIK